MAPACPHGYTWCCPHGDLKDSSREHPLACVQTWFVARIVNMDKKRSPDETKPTAEETAEHARKLQDLQRKHADGGFARPAPHAQGCGCWRCQPGEWK